MIEKQQQTAKAPVGYSRGAVVVLVIGFLLYITAFRPIDWLTDGAPNGRPADTGSAHIVRCETSFWEFHLLKKCLAIVTWSNGSPGTANIQSSRTLTGDTDVTEYRRTVTRKGGNTWVKTVVANDEQWPRINPKWFWVYSGGGLIVLLVLTSLVPCA